MMEDKIESKPIDKWWTLAVIGVIMLGVFVCINVYDEYKADADPDWVDAINSGKSVTIYTDDGSSKDINRYSGEYYHNAKISGGYLTMDKTSGSSHLSIPVEHITKVYY